MSDMFDLDAPTLSRYVMKNTKDPELVKAKDHNGWTPLHEATRGGHLECVKFLISSGLDKVSPLTAREPRTLSGL